MEFLHAGSVPILFVQVVVNFFLCTLVPRSCHERILKHQYYYIVCLMWTFQHPIEVQALLRELFTYILSMHVDPRSSLERTILCKYYLFRTPPLRKLVTFSPSMYLMQSYHYTTQMQILSFSGA